MKVASWHLLVATNLNHYQQSSGRAHHTYVYENKRRPADRTRPRAYGSPRLELAKVESVFSASGRLTSTTTRVLHSTSRSRSQTSRMRHPVPPAAEFTFCDRIYQHSSTLYYTAMASQSDWSMSIKLGGIGQLAGGLHSEIGLVRAKCEAVAFTSSIRSRRSEFVSVRNRPVETRTQLTKMTSTLIMRLLLS
ncbi:hypothetical protein BC629DRAFT_433850 [Irpex lacteus]|nr:hypothetical protein BC629DRAFT_433850 [Irpex lacteus]